MEIGFDGKAVLVTGASRGIGRAIALEFARSGADVAVNYHSNARGAEETCLSIREMGRQSIAYQADVTHADLVERMILEMARDFGGRLDIVVNNAGTYPYKKITDMTDEDWNHVVDTNLKGPFHVSRAAAKRMIENGRGGRIIGIASGAGHSGRPGQAHYCASKAGLILLCKALALELAPYRINVNSISAGFIDVGQFDAPEMQEMKDSIVDRILLKRPGSPEDIARMAVFLASEHASWTTGSDFTVDGGESAGRVPED